MLLPFFVSPLPHQQDFSLWGFFFIQGNKKSLWEIGWTGRVGHRGCAGFGQKLLNTQRGIDRNAHKSPITKWANALKGSSKKKKFTEARGLWQHHQLLHWHRWVPEHSPSEGILYYKRPTLQKIINSSFLGGDIYMFLSLRSLCPIVKSYFHSQSPFTHTHLSRRSSPHTWAEQAIDTTTIWQCVYN